MSDREWYITFINFVLDYIEEHMTEEKIKEIESRSNYFLFLKRNGVKSWQDYFEMCADEELPNITREAWCMFYLEEMSK